MSYQHCSRACNGIDILLLARLGDEDKTVGAKAVNIIQKIRIPKDGNQEEEQDPAQKFHQPRCHNVARIFD